jgi:Cu-processing system ATP-binding protein
MDFSAAAKTVGLSRRYGKHYAVLDVSISFATGECTAIVGHNGAGKSTLIKLLLGLAQPTEGSVEVLGVDPASREAKRVRSQIGFLPENVAFAPGLTGREVLQFYARLKRERASQIGELLDRVGLAGAADRRVYTYSKGMRQRLGLAQALLCEPRLLLLDEPTSGLDPASRQSFYRIIRNLVAHGVTVLLSSHALQEIESEADRIAVMTEGRLVAYGSLDELRQSSLLPVQVRLRVADGISPMAVSESFGIPADVDRQEIAFTCRPAAKMELLRRAAACEHVVDVDVLPPTLDALYSWFMGRSNE